MRYTKIAIAKPFEGKPSINLADLFGASPCKPIILKIPASGQRPIRFEIEGLPEGLRLENGIITGMIANEGNYKVKITAENSCGKTEKNLTFEIKKNAVLLTPMLGFTSWNAFGSEVSQEKMIKTAHKFVDTGISDYGYSYINTDSGWQKEYGGEYDAVMPNEKFPDMKAMCDEIHSLGLKCGIYSTPMRTAWGCPKEFESIPGCTTGEPDDRFSADNCGGIGQVRKEKNNATQWAAWGIDYLKYDWAPTDPVNADIMKNELIKTPRDFGMSVTVWVSLENINYWGKNVNSFRRNPDSMAKWDNFLTIYNSKDDFLEYNNKGHFFDLDMLDVGTIDNKDAEFGKFTEDEQLVAYSLRAFFNSPIQISSTLEDINDFELSMYCNEEIIAINQDSKFDVPKRIIQTEKDNELLHVFRKNLSDGSYALAVFNIGETTQNLTIQLDDVSEIRDIWAKENLGTDSVIKIESHPHTVRIFKIK